MEDSFKENIILGKTEEVQHIIDSMPTRFGYYVSLIIVIIFSLFFIMSFVIKYPDVVTGEIIVSTHISPIKLISNSSGRLRLKVDKSTGSVKEGQVVAYIENSTPFDTLVIINKKLEQFAKGEFKNAKIFMEMPSRINLGDLTQAYYNFVNSLLQYENYKTNRQYKKQKNHLNQLVNEQKESIYSLEQKVKMSTENLDVIRKFYFRDSSLYNKKVLSELDLDRSKINFLAAKDGYQRTIGELINSREKVQITLSEIQEIEIKDLEKGKDLDLSLLSNFNQLKDGIKRWEEKYVLRAPFDGKVQFLKFWTNNQFVQINEPVFTIIPNSDAIYGQLLLPSGGAGKVKIGQDVTVKLNDYPYMEYGSINGKVSAISLTTNTAVTPTGNIETYLITVDFKNGLKTNYDTVLEFRAEAKGSAEIITNHRRFIHRLFDNLSYSISGN